MKIQTTKVITITPEEIEQLVAESLSKDFEHGAMSDSTKYQFMIGGNSLDSAFDDTSKYKFDGVKVTIVEDES